MDPQTTHRLDQAEAEFMEVIPHLLSTMYARLLQEGFERDQAFALTRDYFGSLMDPARDDE